MKMSGYSLRPIEKKDLSKILEWRNSERVHSMMLTNHVIEWDEHVQWFEKTVKNQKEPVHFIFEYHNRPIGYLSYFDIDESSKRCDIGLYIGENNVLLNAGGVLGYFSLAYAFDVLGIKEIRSIVLEKNKTVRKLNRLLGYREEKFLESYLLKNGVWENAFIVSINVDEWEKRRKRFEHMFSSGSQV